MQHVVVINPPFVRVNIVLFFLGNDVGIWTELGWPRIETGGRRL